jgi:transcriptional/translational regulatory protein YebC/TACO1
MQTLRDKQLFDSLIQREQQQKKKNDDKSRKENTKIINRVWCALSQDDDADTNGDLKSARDTRKLQCLKCNLLLFRFV